MRPQVISRDGYNNRLILDSDGNFYTEDERWDPPNGAAARAIIEYFLHRKVARSESLEVFMK